MVNSSSSSRWVSRCISWRKPRLTDSQCCCCFFCSVFPWAEHQALQPFASTKVASTVTSLRLRLTNSSRLRLHFWRYQLFFFWAAAAVTQHFTRKICCFPSFFSLLGSFFFLGGCEGQRSEVGACCTDDPLGDKSTCLVIVSVDKQIGTVAQRLPVALWVQPSQRPGAEHEHGG